jgi:hypothetical protein
VLHEKSLHPQGIGVRFAISCRRLIGLIFFETTVDSQVYQDSITEFISMLEKDEHHFWLKQDGSICYTCRETMDFLKEHFDNLLISKGVWPPRSPDLSTADLFG